MSLARQKTFRDVGPFRIRIELPADSRDAENQTVLMTSVSDFAEEHGLEAHVAPYWVDLKLPE